MIHITKAKHNRERINKNPILHQENHFDFQQSFTDKKEALAYARKFEKDMLINEQEIGKQTHYVVFALREKKMAEGGLLKTYEKLKYKITPLIKIQDEFNKKSGLQLTYHYFNVGNVTEDIYESQPLTEADFTKLVQSDYKVLNAFNPKSNPDVKIYCHYYPQQGSASFFIKSDSKKQLLAEIKTAEIKEHGGTITQYKNGYYTKDGYDFTGDEGKKYYVLYHGYTRIGDFYDKAELKEYINSHPPVYGAGGNVNDEQLELDKKHAEHMTKDAELLEEYKNHKIYKHTSKTDKDDYSILIVHPDYSVYILGMDDSKRKGYREFVKVDLNDAHNYIDWITNAKKSEGGLLMTKYPLSVPNKDAQSIYDLFQNGDLTREEAIDEAKYALEIEKSIDDSDYYKLIDLINESGFSAGGAVSEFKMPIKHALE